MIQRRRMVDALGLCAAIDAQVIGAIGQHRRGACPGDSLGRRDERVGRNDALIAWADIQRTQGDLDRIGPVRRPDTMPRPGERRVLGFERGDLRPAYE